MSYAEHLAHRGPVMQVTVTLADAVAEQWVRNGIEVPGTETGLALIDTGASRTCIDDTVAERLGFPVVDVVKMASASHSQHNANVYPIKFEVVGFPIKMDIARAMGANLQSQGYLLLIGRDVLSRMTLHYNGLSGQFTLSI
jgi:predicted aspartyl protease